MKNIKAYLFDFDGTLVDSMPAYEKMFFNILDREGVSYPDDIINIITPLGTVATAHYMVGMGVKLSAEEILDEMRRVLLQAYEKDIFTKSNVPETVKALKEQGYSVNILTASPHVSLDPCLKNNGIYDLFDNIWSCDDFGTTKTDTAIYHKAAERLGLDVSEILFADDNLDAIKTAKNAGMITCGVYDESSDSLTDVIKETADSYVYNFGEILMLYKQKNIQ